MISLHSVWHFSFTNLCREKHDVWKHSQVKASRFDYYYVARFSRKASIAFPGCEVKGSILQIQWGQPVTCFDSLPHSGDCQNSDSQEVQVPTQPPLRSRIARRPPSHMWTKKYLEYRFSTNCALLTTVKCSAHQDLSGGVPQTYQPQTERGEAVTRICCCLHRQRHYCRV